MNSVKVFDLAKGASDGLWVGSPWSIENRTPANNSFIIAYTKKYSAPPDQFAAQAYDAMHIAAEAMGLCEEISVLNFGRIIARGDPDAIRTDPQVIEAYLGREEDEADAAADAQVVAAATSGGAAPCSASRA